MCEAPVKASGRMVRLALNSSSVAAVVAFSGRVFHSLVDLGKKEYLYWSFRVRCWCMRWPPLVLESPGL